MTLHKGIRSPPYLFLFCPLSTGSERFRPDFGALDCFLLGSFFSLM